MGRLFQKVHKSAALLFALLLMLTSFSACSPESKQENVDPASCEFPQLQAFFNRAAYNDRGRDAHGMEWEFPRMTPYRNLETAVSELLDLLQQPRWQLTLVDTATWTYETGDITQTIQYCFDYTGTAELTKVSDVMGQCWHHVHVLIYHIPENDWYTVQVWRSPEFAVVETEDRCSVEVGTYEKSGSSGGSWKGDNFEVFVPQQSRLDCLKCKGDGDCNTCGGDGYTGFGDAKAGCRTCHGNGKCKACGGSGKR